ncbi:MAG: hypothetical protein J6O00_10855 [Clostridiales bacterium]|nr:hypothetical protein [Clostridiales bacterium]
MSDDIIYCKDCEFRKKKADWKWCDDFGVSPYYCAKGRGLDIAETVNLNDFCSSAKIKEINDEGVN